jgi:hypothetical protein
MREKKGLPPSNDYVKVLVFGALIISFISVAIYLLY